MLIGDLFLSVITFSLFLALIRDWKRRAVIATQYQSLKRPFKLLTACIWTVVILLCITNFVSLIHLPPLDPYTVRDLKTDFQTTNLSLQLFWLIFGLYSSLNLPKRADLKRQEN